MATTSSAQINWDDARARAELIADVGPDAYERGLKLHFATSAVSTINGYLIRSTPSRFGRLFAVHGTDRAFATLAAAEGHALSLPAAA